MAKIIVGLIAVFIIGLLIYPVTKPNTFHIQRIASIKAPPDKIFAYIEDFHKWSEWSPFEKMDPTMKKVFSGAAIGKGSIYTWEGNGKIGTGRMEIVDLLKPGKVIIKLDFLKPFEGHNTAEFTLVPNGTTTEVTWAMDGPSPYLAKIMGIFFNMDKMIGKDFSAGLANLKSLAEK